MLAYDVFLDDAFSVAEMREAADNLVYIPQTLNNLGIFDPEPIRTTVVQILRNNETLTLVPTTERGTPRTRLKGDTRSARYLPTVALRQEDRINGDSFQNIASPGMPYELALANAMDELDKRQRKMARKLELTREFHRLAALQGYVLDADSSVILDVYDEFGISRPAAVTLNPVTMVDGALRSAIKELVVRPIRTALKLGGRNMPTRIVALCGHTFYDAMAKSKEIRETYLNTQQARELREALPGPDESFNYAGIEWIDFEDTADGTTIAIADNECIFVPIGVDDMFVEFRAPGESMDDVNQPGREFYARVSPDYRPNMKEWVDAFLDAYPLYACLVPEALLRGTLP